MISAPRCAPRWLCWLLFTLLTGIVYPGLITAIGQAVFPHQANGSLVSANGRIVGSELIGQGFARPGYFHGRPSAAGKGYDALSSGGSNYGPASKALVDRVTGDVKAARADGLAGNIPADMVTASASGLDPHISPATAFAQVARVAKARGLPEDQVRALVTAATVQPALGVLGEPRVNVLALNRALDGA